MDSRGIVRIKIGRKKTSTSLNVYNDINEVAEAVRDSLAFQL